MSNYVWEVELHPDVMRHLRLYQAACKNYWHHHTRQGGARRMRYWGGVAYRVAMKCKKISHAHGEMLTFAEFRHNFR